mgnify:CR=1 FL=1
MRREKWIADLSSFNFGRADAFGSLSVFPPEKGEEVYLIAVFVLLTLVMAFRSQQVGVDAAAYCSYYMRIGYQRFSL